MSPEDWEKDVIPDFSRQTRERICPTAHDVIAPSFSATTAAIQAAQENTLMAAMEKYFFCRKSTSCGIPCVELRGTEKYSVAVRERAEKEGDLMTPPFRSSWMGARLPVLSEFIAAFQGEASTI
eukprot:Plantae.Rhodophyta-Palmaria_palmata.ctg4334.p1 GENE.Plantae.Rhodophyta-Palmaria_palmata.ctg4334~~Plantae.Rhodophyta-Palmaria_palmata.ctg4334.p1  ORF type:complete len:124 (-),score=12.33 Plantae.Rhodophyta-Palmaria_palmata.ctg4334:168-539(-)